MFNSKPACKGPSEARLRLVCFPYAGGGTVPYRRWRTYLPGSIDLVPFALPGHDGRMNEQLFTEIAPLANAVAAEIEHTEEASMPFVLLGHSMGALLAFEVARSMRRSGRPMPQLLVLTGFPSPDAIVVKQPLHRLTDDELLSALQTRYGGIPTAVRENAELWNLLAPISRADFRMIETYRYIEEPPLDVPLLVLGGTQDPAVPPDRLMGWRRHTTHECSVRQLPGDHFFPFGGLAAAGASMATAAPAPTPALRVILTRLEQCLVACSSNANENRES